MVRKEEMLKTDEYLKMKKLSPIFNKIKKKFHNIKDVSNSNKQTTKKTTFLIPEEHRISPK
jgi:hypothetical protein